MGDYRNQMRASLPRGLSRVRRKTAFIRLTSLIDVFMILLVFLIKNFSTQPEVTLLSRNLTLPISTAVKSPDISTTISATRDSVLVNGKFLDTTENISNQDGLLSQGLYEILLREKKKTLFIARQNPEVKFEGKVTIQADKQTPYKIMKKLIYTCGQAEFGNISLHVLRKDT
ncbi:MAG: ExbD/TolR family protein [bacterium]